MPIFKSKLVCINVTAPATPSPAAPVRLPFVPYEEIFERNGRWLLGRKILAKICRHMCERSLAVVIDNGDPGRLLVSLPEFPTVRNDIDGRDASIWWMIREELRPLVEERCWDALSAYRYGDLEHLWGRLGGRASNASLVTEANSILAELEHARRARRDPADPELWECLADRFGLTSLEALYDTDPFKEFVP